MSRIAIALCSCLVWSVASAQPMMVDPSRMSGIPRPDPKVPAGTITVRLIRGELSNRVTDHEVELADGAGKVVTQKTDAEGRATFSGLSGGPFVAKAKDDDATLTSQPIELPPTVGVRVMLVFAAGGPGAADGLGRPDKTVPAGVVIIKAQDADGKPLAGLDVILGHVRAGEQQVRELKGKTDANGEARFDGVDAKPTSGYLAEVMKNGTRYAGKPFRMSENVGARAIFDVRPITRDVKMLQIGAGSHFIFEITDDAVQVVEVWRLTNLSTDAVDLPGGIHLPLPDNALSTTVGPSAPPTFSATGHEAVWKGPLPPGDTELQVMYVLAYQGDHVDLKQPTPIPFTEVNIVTEKIDGMAVEGQSVKTEQRELQGKTLMLYRGSGTAAGGEILLTVTGLPHSNAIWRYLAGAVSVLLLICFGVYAASGPRVGAGNREKLTERREHLLDELAALESRTDGKDDPKRARKVDELKDRLAKLYKELDEVA